MKKEPVHLIEEGIGKFAHFTTLDGRMFLGDKVGENILRRENPSIYIDFCEGAPKNAEGVHIKRVEKTIKGVYFYTIHYYSNLREYKIQSR